MGLNMCKEVPPPYEVKGNDVAAYKERAFGKAVKCLSVKKNIESIDVVTQNQKLTLQELSGLVYGFPLKWNSIPAYVYTAREINPQTMVLPRHIVLPFLDTRSVKV